MEILLHYLKDYIIPVLGVIISAAPLFLNKAPKHEKKFNSRRQISELSGQLYQSTKNINLQNISYEFGISAITGDDDLTLTERELLLQSSNPVHDIEKYKKCQSIVKVNNHLETFCWRKKEYESIKHRRLIKVLYFATYIIGYSFTILPFIYKSIISSNIIDKINTYTQLQDIGVAIYFITSGLIIMYFSVQKGSTISLAEKLIESNKKPEQLMLL